MTAALTLDLRAFLQSVADSDAYHVSARVQAADLLSRVATKPRKATAGAVAVDPATLSDAELFAHYKRTALLEDARFTLRVEVALSPWLRAEVETLIAGIEGGLLRAPDARRRLSLLQAVWRGERNAAARAAGDADLDPALTPATIRNGRVIGAKAVAGSQTVPCPYVRPVEAGAR